MAIIRANRSGLYLDRVRVQMHQNVIVYAQSCCRKEQISGGVHARAGQIPASEGRVRVYSAS